MNRLVQLVDLRVKLSKWNFYKWSGNFDYCLVELSQELIPDLVNLQCSQVGLPINEFEDQQ